MRHFHCSVVAWAFGYPSYTPLAVTTKIQITNWGCGRHSNVLTTAVYYWQPCGNTAILGIIVNDFTFMLKIIHTLSVDHHSSIFCTPPIRLLWNTPSLVQNRTHTLHSFTHTLLECLINWICMFFNCRRKPEDQENTHAGSWENMPIPRKQAQAGIKPGIFSPNLVNLELTHHPNNQQY